MNRRYCNLLHTIWTSSLLTSFLSPSKLNCPKPGALGRPWRFHANVGCCGVLMVMMKPSTWAKCRAMNSKRHQPRAAQVEWLKRPIEVDTEGHRITKKQHLATYPRMPPIARLRSSTAVLEVPCGQKKSYQMYSAFALKSAVGHRTRPKEISIIGGSVTRLFPSISWCSVFCKTPSWWKSGSGCSGVIHWWDTNMPLPMLSWKRQSAPASISASCVSILVIVIKVFNGTIYMGNVLPPKLPEDRQCSTHSRSILALGVQEPGNCFFLGLS